jgi:simple sugar transport system substrate-binding protein
MKRKFFVGLALLLILCSTSIFANGTNEQVAPLSDTAKVSPVAGKKVAYILNLASSDIFQLCANQCVETSEALGMTCDIYFSNGNDATWQDYISTCAAKGYDGLFLSHGGQNYSYTFIKKIMKQYPNLKIVTFDTQFRDSNGDVQKIPGVTQFFQDDAGFATALLDYICDDICPDKVAAGVPVKVLKVWVGPNYLSPFDRRQVGYAAFEKTGKIKTIETIGPTDYNNAESSMTDVTASTLAKYKKGDIDAVWVTYDAYGRGVYKALMESGMDIPMVSVDICNTDIQNMQAANSVWKACACTDFKSNGEQGIRLLALEMNGDYDCIKDPTTGMQTDWYEMPVSVIEQSDLTPDTTLENLYDVAPATYGAVENLSTCDWMVKAIGY